jgi:hypothetical protein
MRYQGRHNIEVTTTRCEMRGALMSDDLFFPLEQTSYPYTIST